jgi:NAD(P)H-hydrate epimerase
MPSLPVKLYSAADVREMDRRAINDHGLGDGRLMERAGRAAFDALRERWPWASRLDVIAGAGNNGGDGYVLARLARKVGFDARVHAVRDAKTEDAVRAARKLEAAGGDIEPFDFTAMPAADIIVDALMGTGLDRALEGDFAAAVDAINASRAKVLSIDIPSGLNADTGAPMGRAVSADETITFIGMKCGLATGRAPAFTGGLNFAALDVPDAIRAGLQPAACRIDEADIVRALPPRERDAHKGHFGHALVLGGDHGTPGAVRMAGDAALRAGAGLVSVYTRAENVGPIVTARPELMCHADDGVENLAGRASVIAVGPGLGQGEFGRALLAAALATSKPLIVDADGLNLLARHPVARGNWILTPHPGEAARLLGGAVAEVEADRFAAVRELAERFNAVVVLKGAGTLVAAPGEIPALIDRGNPGMASGGMGDVLTGVIAGLRAQIDNNFEAAKTGAFVHASAGDAAAAGGERGLAALDLMAHLKPSLNPCQRHVS